MLTRFPLTIDNILTCCRARTTPSKSNCWKSVENIDRSASGQNRRSTSVSVSWCVKIGTPNEWIRLLDVPEALHMFFWQHLSDFRKILDVSEHFGLRRAVINTHNTIVNILSIFCYHRHSGVVEAAQIPATIDNILTIDAPSNYCNNIFDFLGDP